MSSDEPWVPVSSLATESSVVRSTTFSGLPWAETCSLTQAEISNPLSDALLAEAMEIENRPLLPLPDKLSDYDTPSDQGRRPGRYPEIARRLGRTWSELVGNLPEVVQLADELRKLVSYGLTRRKLEQLPEILNLRVVRAHAKESDNVRILAAVAEDKIAEAIVIIPGPEGRALSILFAPSYRGRGVPPAQRRRERATEVMKVGVWDDIIEQDLLETLARTLMNLTLPTSYYL